ncbi:tyrosine phosphatase [Nesidiocoris tenuis]|uniref:protein-tyrosine-phosphatase n=1 Tax=Nesidiocoris tenuis TaxID=355587 RepID=A0ABN7B5D0_9HEMI|nr:tyrosine phosphatase [Nesidiocoris tenuis]
MGTDNPVSNVENEFREIDARDGWLLLFHGIRTESSKNNFTTKAATKPENKNLNRYRDVSPYDHTRIILKKGKCDYINANLVKIDKADRRYILTQGPLASTTGHFWLMVWEQKSKAIIMLNRIIEKNHEKCHLYWPMGCANRGQDTLLFTDVDMEVSYVKEEKESYYTIRTLNLKDLSTGETRTVLHFHYTAWPDFGCPQSPAAFLRFLRVVRRSGTLEAEGPAIVHCSAGIGRSGTFCLVDSALVIMKKNGNNSISVKDMLLEMRKDRMGLIQTPDQLRFSYLAIIEGISRDWDSINDNEPLDEDENQNWPPKEVDTSSDSSDDDEPPPLPPPRGESLTTRAQGEVVAELPLQVPPTPPDRPLPSEPPTPDGQPGSPTSPNSESKSGDRKRNHEEANSRMAEKIAEMKKKQESAEKWRNVKRKRTD